MFNKVYKYADTLPFSFRKDEFKKGKRKKKIILWIGYIYPFRNFSFLIFVLLITFLVDLFGFM